MALLRKIKDEYQPNQRYTIYFVEETKQLVSVTDDEIIGASFIGNPVTEKTIKLTIDYLSKKTDEVIDSLIMEKFLEEEGNTLSIPTGHRDGSIVPLNDAQGFVKRNRDIFHSYPGAKYEI